MLNNYFTPHYTLPSIILSIYAVLYNTTKPYFFIKNYAYFSILNMLVNILLKYIIRQHRPILASSAISSTLNTDDREKIMNIVSFDRFGMPSGHTQFMGFNTVYTYLVTKNKYILVAQSILTFLSFRQRIVDGFHTLTQTLIGLIVGILVAYGAVHHLMMQ
jgi:membrane-associated phospholipid phosphatase